MDLAIYDGYVDDTRIGVSQQFQQQLQQPQLQLQQFQQLPQQHAAQPGMHMAPPVTPPPTDRRTGEGTIALVLDHAAASPGKLAGIFGSIAHNMEHSFTSSVSRLVHKKTESAVNSLVAHLIGEDDQGTPARAINFDVDDGDQPTTPRRPLAGILASLTPRRGQAAAPATPQCQHHFN